MSSAPRTAGDRPLAPFGRRACQVTRVERVGAYVVLTIADPEGPAPAPGQFSMLAAAERWGDSPTGRPFLARAFSVLRRRRGESEYLLEAIGPGTDRLCELAPGERLWVLGPLGRGFTAPADGARPILVGGGAGVAPLAIWQDALHDADVPHDLLLGFRDAQHAAATELFAEARLATDDGSVGAHGRVTALAAAALDAAGAAEVYGCGPPAMLEALRALCAERGIPAQLALEAPMACGFGACFGCVVGLAAGGYARVCVDGPVFAASELAPIGTHR